MEPREEKTLREKRYRRRLLNSAGRRVSAALAALLTLPALSAVALGAGSASIAATATPVVEEAKAPPSAARPAAPARPAPSSASSSASSSSSGATPFIVGAGAASASEGGESGDSQAADEDTRVFDAAGVWEGTESLARDVAASAALYERDTGHPIYILTTSDELPAEEEIAASKPENMPEAAIEEARDYVDSELALAGAPEDARAIAIFPESEALVLRGAVAPAPEELYSSEMRDLTEQFRYSEALEVGLEEAATASEAANAEPNAEANPEADPRGSAGEGDDAEAGLYLASFESDEGEVELPPIPWESLTIVALVVLALFAAATAAKMRRR